MSSTVIKDVMKLLDRLQTEYSKLLRFPETKVANVRWKNIQEKATRFHRKKHWIKGVRESVHINFQCLWNTCQKTLFCVSFELFVTFSFYTFRDGFLCYLLTVRFSCFSYFFLFYRFRNTKKREVRFLERERIVQFRVLFLIPVVNCVQLWISSMDYDSYA